MLLANPLNQSSLAYPLLESVHVVSIVCGVGTAAMVNLRLLGAGSKQTRPSTLWRETQMWTLLGLTAAIFSGLLLFSLDPEKYFTNQAFRYKMVVLLLAIGVYYTLVRGAATRDRQSVLVALTSLGLFVLVPLAGILIGYV
jgi:Trk-type K+ transport system membrane component